MDFVLRGTRTKRGHEQRDTARTTVCFPSGYCRHQKEQAMTSKGAERFKSFGRLIKTALAARNEHAVRLHISDLDAEDRNAIMLLCDKYVGDNRRRRSHTNVVV